eukprot:TRINITY_DN41226_c0_g1_i1.p1 TRINITY_DN41226_c0_g1~~TRINITY_DN41226_c0_g1_i1.p1  ORF type:complete len:833 (-),score=205.77 TRINITY_DN41226_c0_g1_i1:265-2763(-)
MTVDAGEAPGEDETVVEIVMDLGDCSGGVEGISTRERLRLRRRLPAASATCQEVKFPTAALEWAYRCTPRTEWHHMAPPPPSKQGGGKQAALKFCRRTRPGSAQTLPCAASAEDALTAHHEAPTDGTQAARPASAPSCGPRRPQSAAPRGLRATRPQSSPSACRPQRASNRPTSAAVSIGGAQKPKPKLPPRPSSPHSAAALAAAAMGLSEQAQSGATSDFCSKLESAADGCGQRARGVVTMAMKILLHKKRFGPEAAAELARQLSADAAQPELSIATAVAAQGAGKQEEEEVNRRSIVRSHSSILEHALQQEELGPQQAVARPQHAGQGHSPPCMPTYAQLGLCHAFSDGVPPSPRQSNSGNGCGLAASQRDSPAVAAASPKDAVATPTGAATGYSSASGFGMGDDAEAKMTPMSSGPQSPQVVEAARWKSLPAVSREKARSVIALIQNEVARSASKSSARSNSPPLTTVGEMQTSPPPAPSPPPAEGQSPPGADMQRKWSDLRRWTAERPSVIRAAPQAPQMQGFASRGSILNKAKKSLKDTGSKKQDLLHRLNLEELQEAGGRDAVKMCNSLASGLRTAFADSTHHDLNLLSSAVGEERTASQLAAMKLAKSSSLPVEDVVEALKQFELVDVNGDSFIDYDQFVVAVVRLLSVDRRADLEAEQIRETCLKMWDGIEKERPSEIIFPEFLRWFELYQYKAVDAFLSDEDRHLYDLAKQWRMSLQEVQRVKRIFDKQDSVGRGAVNYGDFKRILYGVLKLPEENDLPEARLRMYWREVDLDHEDGVNFEKFLHWWVHHAQSMAPYEDFYRRIRPVSTREAFRDKPRKKRRS